MLNPSNPHTYKRNYRYKGRKSLLTILTLFSLFSIATAFASHSERHHTKVANAHVSWKISTVPTGKNLRKLGVASISEDVTQDISQDITPDIKSDVLSPTPTTKQPNFRDFCADRAPGLALCLALAHISLSMGKTVIGAHISPLLWATIFGMAYGNLLHRPEAKKSLSSGIKFAKGRLLRLGIILYGFKITLQQIAGIGMGGLMTDVFMVVSTLFLGINLGTKWLKMDYPTSTLIASGSAICGCSAVLATQPVVGGESHEVSAAVGTVVVGGTLSMFLYPFLFKVIPFLANSPKLMGVYTGSTIHEIAGVVAAGNTMGGDVAFTAVVTKLARVLLLAPVLTTLSWMQNRKCLKDAEAGGIPPSKCDVVLPWFAFAFVGVSALNSMITIPSAVVKLASKTSAFSLICAMAALGVDSDFKAIRRMGSKPLLLAGVLWAWLTIGGLGVTRLFIGI
mmetsp:Transcript_3763/g.4336  ORF Transcript_3763/g.4336 Transcript_3763/m.4336 type:complete len:452 (-) Transcript_3763:93-1448(-)|eukprot:CAMPEP_0194129264 /NCGR_PEP_ID=MMETSP0152-20130528/497_1 /TAXON_ID=1049557 /ORGANISM="Thalassiothrix antarctica, Strain L6-D1" /LENGTH=451 /DNA_ID=CAMNT_0038823401 /DNA_START=30 /DNA_END=1385 /DNA_ORIENTATION=-